MTLAEFTWHIEQMIEHLDHYVSPMNKHGFYQQFLDWVIENWESSAYISEEAVKLGCEAIIQPKRTEKTLQETAIFYKDFINGYIETPNSSKCCQIGGDELTKFYVQCCIEEFNKEADRLDLSLPQELKGRFNSVKELVWDSHIEDRCFSELSAACSQIKSRFSDFGYRLSPYIVDPLHISKIDKHSEECRFNKLTLDEFRYLKRNLEATGHLQ